MTRVILACRGNDKKWGNHLGVPKHLAPVPDHKKQARKTVPLIYRTTSQFKPFVESTVVAAPEDKRYAEAVNETFALVAMSGHNFPTEYHSTRAWWNEEGRTILVLGDVFFSNNAVSMIGNHDKRQIRWFGRFGPSRVTGTRYGEIFAISWYPEHNLLMEDLAQEALEATNITRPPGWKMYRLYHGGRMGVHRLFGLWTEIDDETDDLDFPKDYKTHPATRKLSR